MPGTRPGTTRQKLMPIAMRAADWLAAAVAVSLPWSTSATGALAVCWLVAALLTFDVSRTFLLRHPALALPALLGLLAAVGMLWAEVAWAERLQGFGPLLKLFVIPLLMLHFSRSDRGLYVVSAYLVSAIVLLVYSWASLAWPGLAMAREFPGVPIKDPIYQGICFALAVAALVHVAITKVEERRYDHAALCLGLIAAYLVNMAYVATSRTALVVLPVLLVVIAYQRIGARGTALAAVGLALLGSLAVATSPYLRERVASAIAGASQAPFTRPTSESMRIGYWEASLEALREAPVLGQGTGSIRHVLDESHWQGRRPPEDIGIRNPHNQTLAIGVQLGAVGITLLLAMWLSHLWLFAGGGWPAWLGLLVVVQNLVASLFNSHLSDFTAGWLYVFGVGILGGTALRQRLRLGPDRASLGRPLTASGVR
jgi:O-antigen ligase